MKNCSPILLCIFFMLVYPRAGAQDYILTTRGDSLTGEIKPLLYGPQKKIQITSTDKNKTTFSLFEVRAYSQEGEIFHPVKGESGYVFMKLLKPGYLSLYAFQEENQMRFDGLFLKKLDGDGMVVPNLGFKKYIGRYLEDCAEVSNRINEGELGKKNLEEIIDSYNACIQGRTVDHKEIIVQRKEQSIKITTWDALEESIRQKDFGEKTDALEMIGEIKKKIKGQEKIPNFLLESLKNSLQGTGLTEKLNQAISEIGN